MYYIFVHYKTRIMPQSSIFIFLAFYLNTLQNSDNDAKIIIGSLDSNYC